MNLFVADTPLWYKNPIGPSVEISLSYNSQSVITHNEPFGNKWQFSYSSYLVDEGGQVIIYMPDGRRDVYISDGSGGYSRPYQVFNTLTKIAANHFELRFPDDTVYVYNISSGTASFLTEIRDAHNQRLIFGYDSNGRLITITDAMGRVTILNYNANGFVYQATDPFGRSADFEYDANRNLTKITDMGGYWSSFTYSGPNSYLASITDSKGTWNFHIEPSDNNIEASSEYPPPDGTMGYNYRISITDPLGGKEEYYYNSYKGYGWYISPRDYINYVSADNNNSQSSVPKILYYYTTTSGQRGEISQTIYPEGGFTGNGYDATGNNTSISDSYGHTSHYTYNNMGSVASATDAKGITTNMTYAGNDIDLLLIKDGLGIVTMTYNGAHDVTSITDRLGSTTTFTYKSNGQIESQTDALDRVTTYTYDANNYLQQVTRNGKILESFTYDSVGRVRTRTDATGLTLTYDYDNLDDVVKVTYPDAKFITYSYPTSTCPYLIDSTTDRSGRTDSFTYDTLKRLTETRNPEGGVTRNVHDANGNLIKFADPNGNVTAFGHNRDGRLVKKTYADGKYISFYYDRAGLLTSRINARGITTSYTYDQNHNLLSVVYSDGTPGVKYQYDNFNRVTQRQDGTGIYNYTYDVNSQLTSIDGPWADDNLTYQYDAVGNRTSLTQQGGQTISYTYDNLNRLTDIQMGTSAYAYTYSNANPLVQALTRPNGSITNYSYDALNRLTGIANKNSAAAIINQYVYGYNQQDVRSSETITNGNPITPFQNELITYNYNKVNQLLSSTNPDKNFAYDNDGNMTRGYTPEGYVFTATYDAEDHLKFLEYTDGSGVVHRTEYLYSGDGLLVEMKKYENGALVNDKRFVRDGFLVLQERDGGNNVVREYTWGLDMGGGIGGLLNLKQGGQNYSYLYDGKGNVSALLDSSQNVVATYTYDTFGNLMSKTGSLNQPFQFSTKPYDEKTGLSYYGFRFYSPALGRWMTRDPLGEVGGINLYEFVGSDPVRYVDPLGLNIWSKLLGKYVGKIVEKVVGKIVGKEVGKRCGEIVEETIDVKELNSGEEESLRMLNVEYDPNFNKGYGNYLIEKSINEQTPSYRMPPPPPGETIRQGQ